MRYILSIAFIALLIAGCKKDKFTTVPQITFKDISPNVYQTNTADADFPVMTLHITDAEGDLGLVPGKDTSFLYIINLRNFKPDSVVLLPNLGSSAKANFEGDIKVNMKRFVGGSGTSTRDAIYFNIYVKDFAKNKSNVIKTDKPVYYIP